ncbi:MAG: hypothetical protein WBQ23_04420 [Bacteroidota bacterium]
MKHLIILIAIMLLGPDTVFSQDSFSTHGLAIIIRKYDRTIDIWGRAHDGGELIPSLDGELYRSFPTGPKIVFGDQRIPEGIYEGRIDDDGNVSIVFSTYPDMPGFNETYRITGPSLDRNVIPVKGKFIEEIREAANAMKASGYVTIPVVILPGALEPEVAAMLEKAENVREGQSLADVKNSILRWAPVDDYLISTGYIPSIRFEGKEIIIEAREASAPAFVNR